MSNRLDHGAVMAPAGSGVTFFRRCEMNGTRPLTGYRPGMMAAWTARAAALARVERRIAADIAAGGTGRGQGSRVLPPLERYWPRGPVKGGPRGTCR